MAALARGELRRLYRSAQRYIQIVGEVGDATRVSHLPLRDVLAKIAVPRLPVAVGGEPEVVEAGVADDPMAQSDPDLIRDAEAELAAEDERLAALSFPRSGVERKTLRQIHQEMENAQRALSYTRRPELSDWTRPESLAEASKSLTEAGDLARELGRMVRSGWVQKPRG